VAASVAPVVTPLTPVASPEPSPAKKRHSELARLLKEDAAAVRQREPAESDVLPKENTEGVVVLDRHVVGGERVPEFFPPPEPAFEKFIRTGTIWQRVGKNGRVVRVWMKGDRGIMIDFPF
jgi:hypothetical protein